MRLGPEVLRFFLARIQKAPDNLVNSESCKQNIELEYEGKSQLIGKISSFLEGDITTREMRNLWRLSELLSLFTNKTQVYFVKKTNPKISEIKENLKKIVPTNEEMIFLKIHENPDIYCIGRLYKKTGTIKNKLMSINQMKDIIYWAPTLGLVLGQIHDDELGKKFKANLEEHIVDELNPFRIKALQINEYYGTNKLIEKVRISSVAQITGFNGLYHFQFVGDDVKRGVYGLSMRQEVDIRKLSSVGPIIEVETRDLHLFIGNEIIVKSTDGLNQLAEMVHKT